MTDDSCYFVKLYKKNGKIIGHAVSDEDNFTASMLDQADDSLNQTGLDESLLRSIDDFYQSMFVYLDYMPLLLDIAPLLSSEATRDAIEMFLERVCKSKQDSDGGDVYSLPQSTFVQLKKLLDAMVPSFNVQNIFAKNVLVGIVASLDALIGNLIKGVCQAIPEAAISGEETITAREVMSFSNLQEFKDRLISREVETISQAGLDAQITWISNRLRLDKISEKYASWSVLGEIFQRRHVFVHANGRVSAKYIQSGQKYGYNGSFVKLGDTLKVDAKYISSAMSVVFEFGIMLSHLVRTKLPNFEPDDAAGRLNQMCFGLLQRGDYELARNLLEFGTNLRGDIKGSTKDMFLLNLANAHKLLGNQKNCDELISKHDWSNVGQEFRICKDAILEDIDKVVEGMKRASFKEFFNEVHCQEWPVFFHVRDDERFKIAFKDVFGQEFVPRSQKMNTLAEIVSGMGGGKMVLELSSNTTSKTIEKN